MFPVVMTAWAAVDARNTRLQVGAGVRRLVRLGADDDRFLFVYVAARFKKTPLAPTSCGVSILEKFVLKALRAN
jgi:hypothetical protein